MNDKSKSVAKGVFSALGVAVVSMIALVALSVAGLILLLVLAFPTVSTVEETYLSKQGDYQVVVVSESAGAMDRGKRYVGFEYPKRDGTFSQVGDVLKKKSFVKIEESGASYYQEYEVAWESDNTFMVEWKGESPLLKKLLVEVSGKEYTCTEYGLKVIDEKSTFHDFEIVGDKVYERCTLYVENTLDIPVTYTIQGYDDQAGMLLGDYNRVEAVDSSDEEAVFTIEANSSGYIDVVLLGSKGESESRNSRETPRGLYCRKANL